MSELKKCAQCKKPRASWMFESLTNRQHKARPIQRCLECRLKREDTSVRIKQRADEIRTKAIEERGFCAIRGCTLPRIKTSVHCINHFGIYDTEEGVELIRLFSLRCLSCSWYTYCRGTSRQAEATRLLSKMRCPKCNFILELADEGQIVGRIYDTTDKRKEVPATSVADSKAAPLGNVSHLR